MKVNNIEEARRAITTKPLKSTSYERILKLRETMGKYDDQPQPLRFAFVMQHLLKNVSVPVADNDVIVGRYVDKELTAEEEQIFGEFNSSPNNPYKGTLFETGHCTLDWQDLVEQGLPGLKARAERSLKTHENDEDKCVFLRGAIGIYDALLDFIARYAESAEKAGKREASAALRSIGKQSPQNFFEAMQLLWIVAFIDCAYITHNPTLSVGRLDNILYPVYLKDKQRGVSDERIKEIIIDYYCKHNLIMGRGEHQLGDESNTTGWARIINFDAPQYLHLAGTDREGKSAVNELTQLFAECIQPVFKNPVIVVRYYQGMASDYPKLWDTLMGKALESCSLMFYNDNDVISAYVNMGLPLEDAREYEHFGCNWAGLGKDACWMLSTPRAHHFAPDMSDELKEKLKRNYIRTNHECGWVADFVEVVRKLSDSGEQSPSIETIYDVFFDEAGRFFDDKLDKIKTEVEQRCKNPSAALTYGDCFRVPPVEKGVSNGSAAPKWYFEIQSLLCVASVVDQFTVIDQLVCREKKYTLKQMLDAIDANYVGYDDVFASARAVPKFGSDDALSNMHANKIVTRYIALMKEKVKPYVENHRIVLMPTIQSDTQNVVMGRKYGASFDARRAGEPFSQNSRPSFGSCTAGLIGMLNSLLNIPMNCLASGSLNFDVQKRDFEGEQGRALLGKIASTYFDRGGLHMQISCQSVDELLDAQKNPDKHRDLMVRVTGYSGIFVDFSKEVQDYVIERLRT